MFEREQERGRLLKAAEAESATKDCSVVLMRW